MPDPIPELISLALPADCAGQRLDRVLARLLPEFSRTRIQALVKAGKVELDGAVAADASLKVSGSESVRLEVPPPVPAEPAAEAIPLNVVYEDDHLIVIDKPVGLVVHPAAGHYEGTLVNALLAHCAGSLSGIGGVERPGIVHRLDKDTSGLMVAAKTDQAHRALAAQFADHGRTGPLERAYRALVWGVPTQMRGTVVTGIDRDPRNREKMAVAKGDRGREAITHWRVQEPLMAGQDKPLVSLVECRLETGRTHQIRVHMAHIGHPLLGDPVYGQGFKSKAARLPEEARAALENLGRQALHAGHLAFEHPASGELMAFDSPFPADLETLLASLR